MLGNTRITICAVLFGAFAAAAVPSVAMAAAQTYTVHLGDTLGRIAARNHTTVARLVELNKGRYPSLQRNPNLIYSGWVLTISGDAPAASAPTSPPAPPPPPAPSANTYTVVRGDSLSRIAARNHTTVARLVELNKVRYPSLVKNPRLIHAGWVLTVR
jgi:LysM repeat protein